MIHKERSENFLPNLGILIPRLRIDQENVPDKREMGLLSLCRRTIWSSPYFSGAYCVEEIPNSPMPFC
jgi:hypothetical protein